MHFLSVNASKTTKFKFWKSDRLYPNHMYMYIFKMVHVQVGKAKIRKRRNQKKIPTPKTEVGKN